MKPASSYDENHLLEKDRFQLLSNPVSLLFYLTCTTLITIFSLHLISPNTTITYLNTIGYFDQQTRTEGVETCDLFKGQWIPDTNASLYTNYSCPTLPVSKNCFLHGREDKSFLNWRWKPDQCELPRFSPLTFLSVLRGKKMAFIGDSLARNQVESLLCLLSMVETPKLIERDEKNKFGTWEFPNHSFTLSVFWSRFLVAATEIVINGTATGNFDIHLDRVDTRWSEKLPSIDYAVFSDGHWFIRPHNLYEGGKLTGCIFCQIPNVTNHMPGFAIGAALRVAFKAINDCKNCKKIVSFLRTFSPPHFENGTWNTGGGCSRTRPIRLDEVDRAQAEWEYQRIQVEEVERVRREGNGKGKEFEVLDITEMMSTRVDGHPDIHWLNQWQNGYRDCVHWCLPGPIDTWNQLLLQKIISSQN